MATVILVRHGRSTANATGVLAGRLPGVHLDETGVQQAAAVGALRPPAESVTQDAAPSKPTPPRIATP